MQGTMRRVLQCKVAIQLSCFVLPTPYANCSRSKTLHVVWCEGISSVQGHTQSTLRIAAERKAPRACTWCNTEKACVPDMNTMIHTCCEPPFRDVTWSGTAQKERKKRRKRGKFNNSFHFWEGYIFDEAVRFIMAKSSRPHLKCGNVRSNQQLFHVSSGFRYLPLNNQESIVHFQMWTMEIEVP